MESTGRKWPQTLAAALLVWNGVGAILYAGIVSLPPFSAVPVPLVAQVLGIATLAAVDHEKVAGVAYSFAAGSRGSVTPGLFVYPGTDCVLSLLYELRPSATLQARGEIAVSRGVGAAIQASYRTARDNAELDVRYRPRDFAVVGPGDVRGFLGDGHWNRRFGGGGSAALSFAASDFANVEQRALAASATVDQPINGAWSVAAGHPGGSSGDSRSISIPAGVRVDLPRGSVAALWRPQLGDQPRIARRAPLCPHQRRQASAERLCGPDRGRSDPRRHLPRATRPRSRTRGARTADLLPRRTSRAHFVSMPR